MMLDHNAWWCLGACPYNNKHNKSTMTDLTEAPAKRKHYSVPTGIPRYHWNSQRIQIIFTYACQVHRPRNNSKMFASARLRPRGRIKCPAVLLCSTLAGWSIKLQHPQVSKSVFLALKKNIPTIGGSTFTTIKWYARECNHTVHTRLPFCWCSSESILTCCRKQH